MLAAEDYVDLSNPLNDILQVFDIVFIAIFLVEQAIKAVAEIYNQNDTAGRFQILNEVAYSQAQYLSDRIWMEAEGHRTPLIALGSFPGDSSGASDDDFDAGSFLE